MKEFVASGLFLAVTKSGGGAQRSFVSGYSTSSYTNCIQLRTDVRNYEN